MITLTAESKEWKNTGQWIARISGRDSKFTFNREFTGRKNGQTTQAFIDEPGLYEVCDINKKGRKDSSFFAIVRRTAYAPRLSDAADPDLMRLPMDTEEAAAIARRLDTGETIDEIVAVERTGDGYTGRVRTKGEAKKASLAVTIDTATEACWQILQALPEREARKVLAQLKARVSPPKPAAEPAPTAAAEPEPAAAAEPTPAEA